MAEKGISPEALEQAAGLDAKVLAAIIHGRYTPSPQQRRRVAAALGLTPEQVAWGHTTPVTHLYGHGPQFGRTP
jgi:cyanate lyase